MSDTKVLTPDGTQHLIDKIKSEKESTFRYTTMPVASATYADGNIYQYTGASITGSYQHGYFYECKAQGTDPETYAWEQTNIQPTSEGMNYRLVTELPTQNIDTETIYALKPSKNEIISDGNARSITIPYGTASGSESYHSLYDIEAGTVLDVSVSFSGITVNSPGCRINVVINGVSTTIANGTITGSTATISVRYTLNDNFVAARDTFVIVVDHSQWTGGATVNIGKLSILGYVPRKEYDFDYYFNTDGTSDGWAQIALIDKVDDKEDKFRLPTMPTASSTNVGQIIQYTGVTTQDYTNGYFYKCKAQGTDPETYEWQQTNVQPTSEGDERIKPEITEIGVKFDDGLRPYIKVDVSTIIPPFADATWDDIAMISDLYYSGYLSLADVKDAWNIGDSKSIELPAIPATGVGESHEAQTVTLKIVDFDHDTLAESIGENTKAFMTFGFELAENGYMDTITGQQLYGYVDCARRTWCNGVMYDALPDTIKSLLKTVTKTFNKQGTNYYQPTTVTSNEKVFLPTMDELIGRHVIAKGDGASGEVNWWRIYASTVGTRYELYKTANTFSKNIASSCIITAQYSNSGTDWGIVYEIATPSLGATATTPNQTSGIMPHFCI